MREKHFTAIPANVETLGLDRHAFIYNNHTFVLQAHKSTSAGTTNSEAMRMMELNINANLRKSVEGFGPGQYYDPRNLPGYGISHILLTTTVKGKNFSVPIEVCTGKGFRIKLSKSIDDSLRVAATKVMDGIFRLTDMKDVYESGRQLMSVSPRLDAPAQTPGMRM